MGGRKTRGLELKKGVFIIGEGLTEQYYFSHLKRIKNYSWKVKPRFFGKTDISQIDKAVRKLLLGGVTIVCVFDADVSQRNLLENKKLERFKKRYKNNKCVIICDSLPSIEFWFLLHFVKTNKHFSTSSAVELELKKYLVSYNKTYKFLQNPDWVRNLATNQDYAIHNAKELDGMEGASYSNIYKVMGI